MALHPAITAILDFLFHESDRTILRAICSFGRSLKRCACLSKKEQAASAEHCAETDQRLPSWTPMYKRLFSNPVSDNRKIVFEFAEEVIRRCVRPRIPRGIVQPSDPTELLRTLLRPPARSRWNTQSGLGSFSRSGWMNPRR